MSRFSALSKFILWPVLRPLLLAALALNLAGCYEGYKKPNQGNGPGSNKSGGGGGGASGKLYGFTILHVIRASADALVSPSCGRVPTSLASLRTQEIDRRVQATVEYLTSISDLTLTDTVLITPDDCNRFAAISRLANEPLTEKQVPKNLKDKPMLHVSLVLWPGDVSSYWPSYEVTQPEWNSIRRLGDYGFQRRLSVNHFAFVGPSQGYIWRWRTDSNEQLTFMATTILNPSPTPEGVDQVKQSVVTSTVEFAQWLQQRQPQ
jgi:hypothetical protein